MASDRNMDTAESGSVLPGLIGEQGLRLKTLVRLRWLAVAGQTAAVAGVHWILGFDLPVGWCLAEIALSAWLNIFLTLRWRGNLVTDRIADHLYPRHVDGFGERRRLLRHLCAPHRRGSAPDVGRTLRHRTGAGARAVPLRT